MMIVLAALAAAGCALFDPDDETPAPETVPEVLLSASCADLWKHYSDELQLVGDDQVNWQAHDDRAMQYSARFPGACNTADLRLQAASDLRCKALWGVYVKEVDRMTREDTTWREHDTQQTQAMDRIRSGCANTACTVLPGIRCRVLNAPLGSSGALLHQETSVTARHP